MDEDSLREHERRRLDSRCRIAWTLNEAEVQQLLDENKELQETVDILSKEIVNLEKRRDNKKNYIKANTLNRIHIISPGAIPIPAKEASQVEPKTSN